MTAHSTASPDAPSGLEVFWSALPAPAGETMEAQRVSDWAGGPVLVALDANGGRHLLAATPTATGMQTPRPVRGLRVELRRLRIRGAAEGAWIDLACPDPGLRRMFTSLCKDVLLALAAATSPDPRIVVSVVERWRRFWSVPSDGLSREAQLGLLGELWLLTRWLPELNRPALRSWVGPLGGRHDFVCSAISVEVKTTGVSSGSAIHRIQSLDQLADPVAGTLHLLSLRFAPDTLGSVSLDAIVQDARNLVATSSELTDSLDQRLAATGWSPADEGRYQTPWRLAAEALYEVRPDFPRLTARSFQNGLPAGVQEVGYALDTAACASWLVEDEPSAGSRLAALADDAPTFDVVTER